MAMLANAQADYDLFLTRDKDFDETALGRYVTPTFGIVLLAIPQQRGPAYTAVFASLWPSDPQTFVGKLTRLGP